MKTAGRFGHVLDLAAPGDLLELHARRPDRYPALLESCSGNGSIGRFDILFAFPAEALTLTPQWGLVGENLVAGDDDFLRALDRTWTAARLDSDGDDCQLPFHGGWFVFLSYELAQQVEPGLGLVADHAFPVARAVRIPAAVIHDRLTGKRVAVAEPGGEGLLAEIGADVEGLCGKQAGFDARQGDLIDTDGLREDDAARFLDAVVRVQEHIARGDVYQANISRRWQGSFRPGVEAWMVYDRLRRTNPAPFAGIAQLEQTAILSSSPERLVRARHGRLETRPIAGTRPRSSPGCGDATARAGLVASAKERAEHVMLIDLERSDLGKVCSPGSVRVEDFMRIETYAHVHHIESTVVGDLRREVTPGMILRALFPGGTITGCPKVRCMSIIHNLEGRPRGPYTGSMGYINRDGSMDFNILIRSIATSGASWRLDAGSGIVADSVPARELEESRAKAKGMLLSLMREA